MSNGRSVNPELASNRKNKTVSFLHLLRICKDIVLSLLFLSKAEEELKI